MIDAKDRQRRQTRNAIDNLVAMLGEAPGKGTKQVLFEKIEVLTKTLETIEQEWVRLKEERKNVGKNALNFEDAFQLLRVFNQEFHEKAAHEQCEILKEVIHRIVVSEDGITVEYYAGPREDVLSGGPSHFLDDEIGTEAEPRPVPRRTAIRSFSGLVDQGRDRTGDLFHAIGIPALLLLITPRSHCGP